MGARQRLKGNPFAIAANTDYSIEKPAGFYRELAFKQAGAYTASGAGACGLDAGFSFLGRAELRRGNEAIVAMQGTDWRWLNAFLASQPSPISPASLIAAGSHSSIVNMPWDAFHPLGGVDGRGQKLAFAGRWGALTLLGANTTAISGRLDVGGETTDPPDNGVHLEPRWLQDTIDASAANAEAKSIKIIGDPVHLLAAVMIRTLDVSLQPTDPDTARSDGIVRNIRVELFSNGQARDLWKGSWGEAKAYTANRTRMAAASLPSGAVILPLRDPNSLPEDRGLVRCFAGDKLTVYCDTASAIETEFTATAPGAGDLIYITPLGFVPRNAAVVAQQRAVARR
jgi:hypothetical protein